MIEGFDQTGVARLWDDDTRIFTDLRAVPVSVRPYTLEENAAADLRATQQKSADTEATIRSQADAALQGNRDFLALDPPTNAQVLAQVRALTRQNNGLIRLVLRRLDGID